MNLCDKQPIEPGRGSCSGARCSKVDTVHIPDVKADPEYTLLEAARLGGLPHRSRRADAARGRPDRRLA